MSRIIDISRTITPQTAVWPGDTPFSFEQLLYLNRGDAVNLTTLTLSAHTGTHADAPWHVLPDDVHPADLPIEHYIGPARVVSVARQHGPIVPADLDGVDLAGAQRVLIHTWVSTVPDNTFPDGFPYPSPELVGWLADQGTVLLGVDAPSVDDFGSKDLPAHHRLFARGMVNLENLQLDGVPDGAYELIALPLKIAGVCGSPLRAILRS